MPNGIVVGITAVRISKPRLLTVDWPLRLRETQAPFTSRSPGVATLGPSWIPGGQLGCIKDPPTKNWFRRNIFKMESELAVSRSKTPVGVEPT